MLELGTLQGIKHKNNLVALEQEIISHLNQLKTSYADATANSEEDSNEFKYMYQSIEKCLIMDSDDRSDFLQLFKENLMRCTSKEKIKYLIAVKEKSIVELETICWEESQKKFVQNEKDLDKLQEENCKLKKDLQIIMNENESLRNENKKNLEIIQKMK